MDLDVREIARYMGMGSAAPDARLVGRIRLKLFEAPIRPKSAWPRDGDRFLLCGTIGAEFDAWHRRVSAVSAADALIAQAIGAAAIERVMDEAEEEIRGMLRRGMRIGPRRSPGYGGVPLSASREILDKLDAGRRLGVTMTESQLLAPSKSVTAVCELVCAEG